MTQTAQVSSVADFLDKATARDELKNIVKEYSTLNVDEIEEDLELESYWHIGFMVAILELKSEITNLIRYIHLVKV